MSRIPVAAQPAEVQTESLLLKGQSGQKTSNQAKTTSQEPPNVITESNHSSYNDEFDAIFNMVNSFGSYQKLLFFPSCFMLLPVSFRFGFLVFGFATPSFQCATMNTTCAPQQCCENCTSYKFESFFTSTVTEWSLVCDRAYLNAVIQSCFFGGMFFGGFVSGMVSDAFGRKICIFIFNGLMTVPGFVSSFSTSVPVMAFLWFVVGFGLDGLVLSLYVFLMEMVGPKYRTMAANVYSLYGCSSYFVFLILAYYIREWRHLLMVTTAPGVLLYIFWRMFPESPRWLVAHDKLDEAHAILKKYGGKDKKTVDQHRLEDFIENVRNAQIQAQQTKKKYTPLALCRTPKLRKWSAALGVSWFSVLFLGNAFFLFLGNLTGNLYQNFAIMQVIATLQQPINWLVLKMFGRRIPHIVVLLLVGILCFSVLLVPDEHSSIRTGLFVTATGAVFCMWTTTLLMTSELYPTVIRNTAQGTGSMIGRIGAITAPFAAMLGRLPGVSETVPVVIFGVTALVAAVVALLIPETLFAPMHQTIEEAENTEEDYGIPCCGKPRKSRMKDIPKDTQETEPLAYDI